MKISSEKIAIIVREAGYLKSLFPFLSKNFLKRGSIATYGFENIPNVQVFPHNSSETEIIEWIQNEQFQNVIFLSNQAGVLPDSKIAFQLKEKGIKATAQSIKAAELGSDKIKMKHFFRNEQFPTSKYEIVSNLKEAKEALSKLKLPVLLKANNLSDGRKLGVIQRFEDIEEYFYENAVDSPVIMEEFIEGMEVSVIVYCNGESHIAYPVVVKPNTNYLFSKKDSLRKRCYVMAKGVLDAKIELTIQNMARKLSEKINNQFLLGLDIVIGKNGPCIMEFNARVTETLRMSMLGTDSNIIQVLLEGTLIESKDGFIERKGITLDIPHSEANREEIISIIGEPLKTIETDVRTTYHFAKEHLPEQFIQTYL